MFHPIVNADSLGAKPHFNEERRLNLKVRAAPLSLSLQHMTRSTFLWQLSTRAGSRVGPPPYVLRSSTPPIIKDTMVSTTRATIIMSIGICLTPARYV